MRTDQNITKRQLVAHEDYSSIANCRTKIPAIFRGIFGIFRGISIFLFIYSTISRGTPDDVLRNPGWETLVWSNVLQSERVTSPLLSSEI
jgi:hypothetical protein